MNERKQLVKIIISILLLILLIVFFSYMFRSEFSISPRDKSEIKAIRVGYIPNTKPYSYKSESGLAAGFNIDVINAISLETGISVEFVEIMSNEIILSMIQNKVDCVIGVDYKNIPREYIILSEPFIENKLSIFVDKYNSEIRDLSDLKYKRISVSKEDPYKHMIEDIEGIRIFFSDNIQTAVELFMIGASDAYVGDKYIGTDYIYGSKYRDKIKSIGDQSCEWMSTLFAIKKNKEIIELIDHGFREIKNKGTFDTIKEKWIGKNINENLRWFKRFMFFTTIFAMLIIAGSATFYRINRLLKKQIEERTIGIREEKKLKESIIDSLMEGLIFIDTNGTILSSNPSAQFILGERDEIINKNIYELKNTEIFDKQNLDYVIENKVKILKEENTIFGDYKNKSIEYSMTPVFTDEGRIKGVTLTFMDITEEKVMKKKIITKDKLESIGRLTAGIAHEIRNPLTAIGMYAKLIPEKIESESFRRQLLEDMPKEINRLDNIIKSLLDYAKPSPPQKELFNLNEEVDSTIRFLYNQLRENDIELIIGIDESIDIIFDKQQFKQILINIMINSIDALKASKSSKYKCIIVEGFANESSVSIEIADNGEGIQESLANSIFEPFFSTKADGYGLGLSIVNQLVKENGSEIIMDMDYKKGAKFIIMIPLAFPDA